MAPAKWLEFKSTFRFIPQSINQSFYFSHLSIDLFVSDFSDFVDCLLGSCLLEAMTVMCYHFEVLVRVPTNGKISNAEFLFLEFDIAKPLCLSLGLNFRLCSSIQ